MGGDLFVLDRDESGQRLEDRHRRPVRGIDVGELDPDGTGADDDQRLRCALLSHGAVGRDHELLVDRDAGQRFGLGARGQDHRARLDGVGPALALDLHHPGARERAASRHQRDLVLPEEELDALGHAIGDAAAALDGLGVIGLEALHPDPEVTGALEQMDDLGIAEQGLGGDAAPVQTHPAGTIVLDRGDAQPELSAANRGDVPARPRPDHRHIDLMRRHSRPRDAPPYSRNARP